MNRRSMLIPVAVLAATVAASPSTASADGNGWSCISPFGAPGHYTDRAYPDDPPGPESHHRLAGDLGRAHRRVAADRRARPAAGAARSAADRLLHRHPPDRADVPPHRWHRRLLPWHPARAGGAPRARSPSARSRPTTTSSTGRTTRPRRASRPSTSTRRRPRSARRRCGPPTSRRTRRTSRTRRRRCHSRTATCRTPATASSRSTPGSPLPASNTAEGVRRCRSRATGRSTSRTPPRAHRRRPPTTPTTRSP